MNDSIVKGRTNPGTDGVKGQAFHPCRFGFKFGQHPRRPVVSLSMTSNTLLLLCREPIAKIMRNEKERMKYCHPLLMVAVVVVVVVTPGGGLGLILELLRRSTVNFWTVFVVEMTVAHGRFLSHDGGYRHSPQHRGQGHDLYDHYPGPENIQDLFFAANSKNSNCNYKSITSFHSRIASFAVSRTSEMGGWEKHFNIISHLSSKNVQFTQR